MRTWRRARTAESSRRRHRRRRGDAGVSSIELAIIAPTLLVLIFLIIQAALFFYGRSVALQAAREGVSQLRLQERKTGCLSERSLVETATVNYAHSVGSGALTGASAHSTCDFGFQGNSTVTVRVSGKAISLIGFTLQIHASATGRVEQFQNIK